MKLFFMLAYCRQPVPPNPVLVELIANLRSRGVQLDLGIAQETPHLPGPAAGNYDLYVLKSHSNYWLGLAALFHKQGARLLNPYPACIAVEDKIVATQRLQAAGIPVPRSWITGDFSLLAPIAAQMTLIVKPYNGGRGAGIFLVRHPDDLAVLPPPKKPVLVQEFIQGSGEDLKVYVIGDQVAAVRKPFTPDSYAAPGQPVPVSAEVREIALRCGKVFGLSLYGLDLIESESGPKVVDLNYFPSYKGVPEAAGLICEHILSSASNPSPGLELGNLFRTTVNA